MNSREVAWRVFAGELNDASLVEQGEEERSPTYVITPLGARINRVYTVGVLTELENAGTQDEPFWKARISDPTGTVFVSAGQFQPESAMAMGKLEVPQFVAVIGKVRTYNPEDGVLYVSVRPEVVKVVDRDTRDIWVMEAARSLKQRIDAVSDAMEMSEPDAGELASLGYPEVLCRGIPQALAHYGSIPLDRYRTMLLDALRFLLPEEQDLFPETEPGPSPEEEEEDEMYDGLEDAALPPPIPPEDEPDVPPGDADDFLADYADEKLTDEELAVMRILLEVDPENEGAEWDSLVKSAKSARITEDVLDKAMNGLLDKGLLYEPVLGRFRRS